MQHDIELDATLLAALRASLGAERVHIDQVNRAACAEDVYASGALPAAVLAPADADSLRAAVRLLAAAGRPMLPRGGGVSYSSGYLAERGDAVVIDLRGLDRVVEIAAEDGYVVVESGCTWAALDAALAPHGLRTPYWGPLSGRAATVGGALSQGSVFLGSGEHGAAAASVLGLELCLADGSALRTGSAGPAQTPFLRGFGPDLNGLFLGDCGALAIKTAAVLRLIARPPTVAYLSFGFDDAATALRACGAVARAGLAAECFGFDPVLAAQRSKRAGLAEDARTLGRVLRRHGVGAGARLLRAGRELATAAWSLHAVVEARDQAALDSRCHAVRELLAGARELSPDVPRVLRSQPFGELTSMLGPAGERWVPVHGIVPISRAPAALAALQTLFRDHVDELHAHRIVVGYLYSAIAHAGVLIEPVFYWPDARLNFHECMLPAAVLQRLPRYPPAPQAVAAVDRLRRAAADALSAAGAVHLQIGRFYDYRGSRDPSAWNALVAIKRLLDPHGLMNPGVLGL